MIDGNDIIEEVGVPEGPLVGLALTVASYYSDRKRKEVVLQDIKQMFEVPEDFTDMVERAEGLPADPDWAAAVQEFAEAVREKEKRRAFIESLAPMDEPAGFNVLGEDIISDETVRQMEGAMRLPPAEAGALMPDAHPIQPGAFPDFNLPVGGVLGLEDAVAPHAVGYDIGCSMMISIYRVNPVDQFIEETHEEMAKALMEETAFGRGASFEKENLRSHEIMRDERWENFPDSVFELAKRQLGSSGGSNHFVEWGNLHLDRMIRNTQGWMDKGPYLALLSHSGSRAVGPYVCDKYKDMAMERCWGLPDEARHLSWLPLEEGGNEYLRDMGLAGDYAQANHELIHEHVARAIGLEPTAKIFNAHNLAWKETHQGKDLVVHRKGATPAHEAKAGIIPGSMGENARLVAGKGLEKTLCSASHGAGRRMSRSEAKEELSLEEENGRLADRGVTVLEGGLDDRPSAYKNLGDVMDRQSEAVESFARFKPRIVRMANK